MTDTSKASGFPYKSLIWALVTVLSIFLFKDELKQLLNHSEELTVFGVSVKTSKKEVIKLTAAIEGYQGQVSELIEQLDTQEFKVNQLEKLKEKLEKDIAKCPEVEKSTRLLNTEIDKIFKSNNTIKSKTDQLKSVKIITGYKMLNSN